MTRLPPALLASGAHRPWVVGGMAHGISSVALVNEAARAGCLAFYGAAGLDLERVSADLAALDPTGPVGVNLAHADPARDAAVLACARAHGIDRIEVSGFLRPTPEVIAFRFGGPSFVLAKVSRLAAAQAWLAPPHARTLRTCVEQGLLTNAQADRARDRPCADGLILEGDSGGHTDRRSWLALLPAVRALPGADRAVLAVAGGLGTPEGVRAALASGADLVVGGSVHQSCLESGVREPVRTALLDASVEDFAYAPSAVWFGTPARVQVLANRFASRADRLERVWLRSGDERLAGADLAFVESLLGPLPAAWSETSGWLEAHDPELLRGATTRKARLALLCRRWLATCARRAVVDDGGDDVQIWSGPAVAALNARSAGSPLARERPVGALVRWLCPQEFR
ncbi:MAG: nitronate monooxygenase [Myxococcota bacterium]